MAIGRGALSNRGHDISLPTLESPRRMAPRVPRRTQAVSGWGRRASCVPREGDPDRLLRGDRAGGLGPRKSGEAEGIGRMVMSTPVSISAGPPIGPMACDRESEWVLPPPLPPFPAVGLRACVVRAWAGALPRLPCAPPWCLRKTARARVAILIGCSDYRLVPRMSAALVPNPMSEDPRRA